MKKYFIITGILTVLWDFSSYCNSQECDCKKHLSGIHTYRYFNSPLNKTSELNEIFGSKKEELIKYALTINDNIIKKEFDVLNSKISDKEFRNYSPEKGISSNISLLIKKELKERKGTHYNFLFDIMKLYQKGEKINLDFGEDLDVRTYLICFKDKLTWRTYCNLKSQVYWICFSIPDWLMVHFDFFSYKVKEENGKYILVGF